MDSPIIRRQAVSLAHQDHGVFGLVPPIVKIRGDVQQVQIIRKGSQRLLSPCQPGFVILQGAISESKIEGMSFVSQSRLDALPQGVLRSGEVAGPKTSEPGFARGWLLSIDEGGC